MSLDVVATQNRHRILAPADVHLPEAALLFGRVVEVVPASTRGLTPTEVPISSSTFISVRSVGLKKRIINKLNHRICPMQRKQLTSNALSAFLDHTARRNFGRLAAHYHTCSATTVHDRLGI